MDALMQEVERLLDHLAPETLIEIHQVQGFDETGMGILMHVVEHFS